MYSISLVTSYQYAVIGQLGDSEFFNNIYRNKNIFSLECQHTLFNELPPLLYFNLNIIGFLIEFLDERGFMQREVVFTTCII